MLLVPAAARAETKGTFNVEGGSSSFANGVLTVTGGDVTISMGSGAQATSNVIVFSGGGTIDATIENLNISTSTVASPISIASGTTVNLTVQGTNNLNATYAVENSVFPGTDDGPAAFLVPAGATLTVTEGSTGTLNCTASCGSGIGGNGFALQDDRNAGTIAINGGTINALGGSWSAGIGGGHGGGDGGTITITGGEVTARAGVAGAGIGGACQHNFFGWNGLGVDYGNAGSISITGGFVNASGGGGADSIGAGAGGGGGGGTSSVSVTGGYFHDSNPLISALYGKDLPAGYISVTNTDPATSGRYNRVVVEGAVEKPFAVTGGIEGEDWAFWDNNLYLEVRTSTPISITMNTESNTVKEGDGWAKNCQILIKSTASANVAINGLQIKVVGKTGMFDGPFRLEPGASLNLTLYGDNTFIHQDEHVGGPAALQVPKSSSVTIGEGEPGASLYCMSRAGAAIGGAGISAGSVNGDDSAHHAGTITINSGTVICEKGDNDGNPSAALGGGGVYAMMYNPKFDRKGDANIVINGGDVTVIGGRLDGAVIGPGGQDRPTEPRPAGHSDVKITGGRIKLTTAGKEQYATLFGTDRNNNKVSITGGMFVEGNTSKSTVYSMGVSSGYNVINSGDSVYPYAVVKNQQQGTSIISVADIPLEFTYDGSPLTADDYGITAFYGSSPAALNELDFTYVLQGDSAVQSGFPINAGTYTCTATVPAKTLDGVYYQSASKMFNVTITKVPITPRLVVDSKRYDGNTDASFAVYFDGVVAGEVLTSSDYTLTPELLSFLSAEAGRYDFSAKISFNDTAVARNYELTATELTAQAAIYENGFAISVRPDDAGEATYGDVISFDVQLLNLNPESSESVDDRVITLTSADGRELGRATTANGGMATITYNTAKKALPAGERTEVVATFAGDLSADIPAVSASTTVNLAIKKVTVDGVAFADKTYDGTTAATPDMSGFTVEGIASDDTWLADDFVVTGTYVDANASKESKAISYKVSFADDSDLGRVYEVENADGTGSAKINKASLTVTADSLKIAYQAEAPSYTFTPVGLADGETAGQVFGDDMPTLKCEYTKGNPVGSYTIEASGTAFLDNYTVTYASGTLTVAASTSELKIVEVTDGTTETDAFRYDDVIHVKATVTATGLLVDGPADEGESERAGMLTAARLVAPTVGEAALYWRPADGSADVQLTDAVKATSGQQVSFAYDTTDRLVPVSAEGEPHTFVVKFVADESMASSEGIFTASLAARPVMLDWSSFETRAYDAKPSAVTAAFADPTAEGEGILANDAALVELSVTGGDEVSANHGDETAHTATASLAQASGAQEDVTSFYAITNPTQAYTIEPAAFTYEIEDQRVLIGSGIDAVSVPEHATGVTLPDGTAEPVAGALSWFTDEAMQEPLAEDWHVPSGETTLWWSFAPDASETDYVTMPVTGSIVVTGYYIPPTQYKPTVDAGDHGTVEVDPERAQAGKEVTITVTPDDGYEVCEVSVVDKDGNDVELVDNGDNTWTYTQPACDVAITVFFRCLGGDNCPAHDFADVPVDAWYHDAIDWAIENGILNGYGDGEFMGPLNTITRVEMTQVLWNQAGRPAAEADLSQFTDVDAGGWYADAVAWCLSEGIFQGYGDTFGTERAIGREEVATVLWRLSGEPESSLDLSSFSDSASVSEYATGALAWAVESGVVTGKDDGTALDPQGVCTRAEAAAMLMRLSAE